MKIRIKDNYFQISFYIYFLLMVLVYGGYVLLFNYRMSLSEVWLSKSALNILTADDIATMAQLGKWSEALELFFIILFVLMSIFCFLKKKVEKNILLKFLVANIFLSIGILVASMIISTITPLLIMDLLLPLINLLSVIILMSIYIIIEWFIKKSTSLRYS